jgi:hypothetical protein
VLELVARLKGFKESLEVKQKMQFHHRVANCPLESDVKVDRREISAEGLGEAFEVAFD